jgi:septal ring factor EnvC (AmiA/AmiB activator)
VFGNFNEKGEMRMKNLLLRIVVIALFSGLFAPASFSQISFSTAPGSMQPPDPFAGVKQALNLTDSQVSQLQSLLQSQSSSLQPLLDDMKAKQEALQRALQGSDATAIGNAMLALQSSQKALKSAQDANHDALMAVLTSAQQQIANDYLKVAQNGGLGPLEVFGKGPIAGLGGVGGLVIRGARFPIAPPF